MENFLVNFETICRVACWS